MFKTILFATDGSPAAERVLLYVEHMARVENARVHVLHAYELPSRYAGVPGYDRLIEEYRAVAQAVVDDAVEALREVGIEAEGEAVEGSPALAILEAAKRLNVELIMMGTRGATSVAEVLGSVSTRVLRNAPCPVLVVP